MTKHFAQDFNFDLRSFTSIPAFSIADAEIDMLIDLSRFERKILGINPKNRLGLDFLGLEN